MNDLRYPLLTDRYETTEIAPCWHCRGLRHTGFWYSGHGDPLIHSQCRRCGAFSWSMVDEKEVTPKSVKPEPLPEGYTPQSIKDFFVQQPWRRHFSLPPSYLYV